jgi:hypothetical protein
MRRRRRMRRGAAAAATAAAAAVAPQQLQLVGIPAFRQQFNDTDMPKEFLLLVYYDFIFDLGVQYIPSICPVRYSAIQNPVHLLSSENWQGVVSQDETFLKV